MILTYDPWSDGATLSGGAWAAGLPLTNLQRLPLAAVARSTSAAEAATQMTVDLGRPRKLSAWLLGPTNLTAAYRYRLRGYAGALTDEVFDSGWLQPMAADRAGLGWDAPRYWSGLTDASALPPLWLVHVFAARVNARSWRLELSDAGNPAGYVQAGRLFLGRSWRPSTGIAVQGNGHEIEDATWRSPLLGGGQHVRAQRGARICRFGFDHLPEDEAFGDALDVMARAGYAGEVHVIPDPADGPVRMQRRAILGRIMRMDALTLAHWRRAATGFEIQEILA